MINQIWNRMKTDSFKVGGGTPVWAKPPERKQIGGIVMNRLQDMEKISAGSPVEFDRKTKSAKFLKCWEVKSASENGTNTDIVIKATFISPELYGGMVIMKMPNTLDATGKAVMVGFVKQDKEKNEVSFSVPTADIDVVKKGDFLVESASESTGVNKGIYCTPNNVSLEDVIGGDVNMVGIPNGVKYLYENTIAAMPDIVKEAIPLVEWEWFNQKQ